MNPQLSATAQDRIRNLAIPPRKNDLLTKHHNCLYSLFITPPGSFGERVRSRSERGGSCFITFHFSQFDQHNVSHSLKTFFSHGKEEKKMNDHELEQLLADIESDRAERKSSASDTKKIRQAICAFANDMPNHRLPGVIFVGANDDGSCAGISVTDDFLLNLSHMRSDGNVLPMPMITVQKRNLCSCDMAVIIVEPSDLTPVRFEGRIWIRVGPRRAIASAEEERRLSEKRRSRDLPFDLHPMSAASVHDLDLDLFQWTYLAAAISPDILDQNERSIEQQLTSLRFVTPDTPPIPTVAGLLAVGKSPSDFIPGAYVQFLRLEGADLTDPIADQKPISGPLPQVLRELDEIFKANIRIPTDIISEATEVRRHDYPIVALQQFIRNAVMHRDYQTSNAPVRVTWFTDRIEIQNPGGPFGQVTRQNFGRPGITDYRNPNIAEIMKNLGYVQRFGVGIQIAQKALTDSGNPQAEFQVEDNHVLVTVRRRT
jgi:ATP-dependent DNA helicase RecG